MSKEPAAAGKRRSIEELESKAKRLRLKAADAINEAQKVEAQVREARKIKPPVALYVGCVFSSEFAELSVSNGKCEQPDESSFSEMDEEGDVDEYYYWGRLTRDGPLYLIEDVEEHGDRIIYVHRNVKCLAPHRAPVPVKQRCEWS